MITLASYNIKGGVGKTATAVNLAYLAAQEGARVLIWDLDPQGAASFYFRIKPRIRGGINKLLNKKTSIEDHIKGTDYDNLDLIPADFSYRNMDILLEEAGKPQRKLRKLLRPLADEYDIVFLDCAPSISLVSESVFQASDRLLIPTIPTILSLRTLNQIIKYRAEHDLADLQMFAFFSMVDRRKQMHRQIVERPPSLDIPILSAFIPYASEVERMGVERRPLNTYAASSVAAQAYVALWQELLRR
jgi:cellulose biosynthesis protein BcsQ